MMNMVWHEPIPDGIYVEQGAIFVQEGKVKVVLRIGEEHPLTMIAALSNVMWISGNKDTSNPRHH